MRITNLKYIILFYLLLSLMLSSCGPSTEELAATDAGQTAAAATNTHVPSETPRPTITPIPTPSFTPTPKVSEVEIYHPHRINEMKWYVVTSLQSGEVLDLTSITNLDTEKLPDGTTVNVTENLVGFGQALSYDYIEVQSDQILLRRYVSNPPLDESDFLFDPALVYLQSPLEVGHKWQVGYQTNIPDFGKKNYEVIYRGDVTIYDVNYQDCVEIERTSNVSIAGEQQNITDFRSTYCPDVGLVIFEHLVGDDWMRGELLMRTTARIILESVTDYVGSCVFQFYGEGFAADELMSVVIHPPEGNSYTALEGFPASIHLNHPISSQDPYGNWLVEFIGGTNNAMFVFQWAGECEESMNVQKKSQLSSQIQERGIIQIGVRNDDMYPMNFQEESIHKGFEIDLAIEIVSRLFGDDLGIEWIPLSAQERIEAVQNEDVDFLIRNLTHTTSRAELVLFSSTYFLEGGSESEPLAIAVSQTDPVFRNNIDGILLEIIEDGTWQKIYDRWFDDPPTWTIEDMLSVPPVNR